MDPSRVCRRARPDHFAPVVPLDDLQQRPGVIHRPGAFGRAPAALDDHAHLLQVELERVLTPFMGVGSEVYGAIKTGRFGIGVELEPSYYRQSLQNLSPADKESTHADLFTMAGVDVA